MSPLSTPPHSPSRPPPQMPPSPPASCPRSTPSLPAGHFLSIPGELRNQIYSYYLHLDGGYVYNFPTRSLSAAQPHERLDLSLQFTCRRVYREMRGLALTSNVIHFYPIDAAELRIAAARYQALCWLLGRRLTTLVWPEYLFSTYCYSPVSREEFETTSADRRRAGYEADSHPDGENASWPEHSRQEDERDENCSYEWRLFQEDPRTRDRRKDPEISLDPCAIPLINQGVADEVVLTYPEMRHLLLVEPPPLCNPPRSFRAKGIHQLAGMWGTGHIPDSRFRDATIHTVQVAIKQCHFTGPVATYASTLVRLASHFQDWAIPSTEEMDDALKQLRACGALNPYDHEMGPWGADYWKAPGYYPLVDEAKSELSGWLRKPFYAEWRTSAAAASVRFLEALPDQLRLHVRTMVLHENRTAAGFPECHGLGLIPFCQANPLLRIERRVALWRNIFMLHGRSACLDIRSFRSFERRSIRTHPYDSLASRYAPSAIERWISEALTLEASGMPSASFSLVLENDEGHDQYSEIYELLRLDAVYMQAAEKRNSEKPIILPANPLPSEKPFYTVDRWPEAVQAIADGKSIVRCDFPLRPDLLTVDRVLDSKPIHAENLGLLKPGTLLRHESRQTWIFGYHADLHGGGNDWQIKLPPALEASWEELEHENLMPAYFESGEAEGDFLDTDSESSDSSTADTRPSSPSA